MTCSFYKTNQYESLSISLLQFSFFGVLSFAVSFSSFFLWARAHINLRQYFLWVAWKVRVPLQNRAILQNGTCLPFSPLEFVSSIATRPCFPILAIPRQRNSSANPCSWCLGHCVFTWVIYRAHTFDLSFYRCAIA